MDENVDGIMKDRKRESDKDVSDSPLLSILPIFEVGGGDT
jgi:hypothetical protein